MRYLIRIVTGETVGVALFVNQSVEISIEQFPFAGRQRFKSKLIPRELIIQSLGGGWCVDGLHFSDRKFKFGKLRKTSKIIKELCHNAVFPVTHTRTSEGVTTVIDVALLSFGGQIAVAMNAPDHSAENAVMGDARWWQCVGSSFSNGATLVEGLFGDERLVLSDVGVTAHADQSEIEGVGQKPRHLIGGDGRAVAVPKTANGKQVSKLSDRIISSRIHREGARNQRAVNGIDCFWQTPAGVKVARWRTKRVDALLETPHHTLPDFITQVPDVVGCNHGLDVGGESTATGLKVDGFMGEMHINACIHKGGKLRPVSKVSGTAINFVNDEAVR